MAPSTLSFYEDSAGEWRFRVRTANGEIIAPNEGYTRRADAVRGAHGLLEALRGPVEFAEDD